ncbi:MAG TPA: hypothetical protein VFU69_10805, partial [Ktedonobacterales bacterium]|nr:hypothetical protein [Ktedonobacterales bacterium]
TLFSRLFRLLPNHSNTRMPGQQIHTDKAKEKQNQARAGMYVILHYYGEVMTDSLRLLPSLMA